ncbi:acetylornithine/succinylornithine family transaminase [Methanomicrobium antiquum]|uniref:Acetylornithine/succinylornithine family transaminase n=1 Tax=Methanomicrobium antiquum TaxID=487686 RepID=A0AAF0FP80_9EURY|nr:acetylornithine/succinylornithine family transaminase [Methanomicrobium antiquum]WFN37110.1 acetylornithine/succinylornithine family transaminase [Methanomicrobium antiquum]
MEEKMSSKELEDLYFMKAFGRDLKIVKGSGSYVWDENGKKYLDCVAGIAVCVTGHCNPEVVDAICNQAKELIHISNLYYVPNQGELAKKVVEMTGIKGARAFFSNSGAEANDGAIKLARIRTGRKNFVAFVDGFHGRTLGSLAVTHKPAIREPFDPLEPKCTFVRYGDLNALEKAVDENTAGVFVEGIQGEAGIVPAPEGFYEGVRKICDEKGALMICDEVQSGMGRTGKWFYYQHTGITPDIVSIAKGIASGLPMGAIVARDGLTFNPGEHGSTFAGGPILCAAALTTIKIIEENLPLISEKGKMFMDGLSAYSPRGMGLMIGIPAGDEERSHKIAEICRKNGVLVNCASHATIRIVPPLTISKEEIKEAVSVIDGAFKETA